ncbi:MAG: septum formation initiator, partial [Streptomyces sp.]|nr:septum formation initiator [Streptomyces sp.]
MSPARGRAATAARTPFVVLVVTLLGGGLISLLLLNAAVNRDSFKLNKLEKETTGYTDEQQQLQQEVDRYGAPGTLERKARELGMVPGGNPAFLDPDGSVRGTPQRATAPPAPPKPSPSATSPSATPTGPAAPADATTTAPGTPPATTAPGTAP